MGLWVGAGAALGAGNISVSKTKMPALEELGEETE